MNSPPKIPPFDPLELTRRLNAAAGTRAPLVMWMIENYDELDRVLSLARVNWLAFAGYVTELGFLNARGKSLSPQNVRQCWGRAKKTHAAQSARLTPSKSPTPRPVDPVPAPPPAEPRFKVARAHDEHLWTQQPAVPVPTPAKSKPPQEPNPAYAGLSREQIADKILGRKPKDPS